MVLVCAVIQIHHGSWGRRDRGMRRVEREERECRSRGEGEVGGEEERRDGFGFVCCDTFIMVAGAGGRKGRRDVGR